MNEQEINLNEENCCNDGCSCDCKEESIPQKESILVDMIEKDIYLRLASEYENYKRRTTKEKEDYFKTSNEKVLLDIILPTIDNFERAGILDEGLELIYTNLKNSLSRYNVKEIDTKGLEFNPDTMEAITSISIDGMSGKVVDVIEKGYEINNKVLRFSKVVVGA